MRFASKYILEIRTCSEENTVLPVHETYFLVSLWEPNELQNICMVQSVNYAFMYVEEMSHDGGSHWTWSIVGFYPLLSLKASLNSQVRQWHCQSRRWISLATQRSCLSAQKVSPALDSADISFAKPGSGLLRTSLLPDLRIQKQPNKKTEQKAQISAKICKSNHANEVGFQSFPYTGSVFLNQVSSPQVFKKMSTLQKHLIGTYKRRLCIIQGPQELPNQKNGFERPICVTANAKYLHFNGLHVTVYIEHFNKSQQYSFWICKLALLLQETFKSSNICNILFVCVLLQSMSAAKQHLQSVKLHRNATGTISSCTLDWGLISSFHHLSSLSSQCQQCARQNAQVLQRPHRCCQNLCATLMCKRGALGDIFVAVNEGCFCRAIRECCKT